MFSIDRRQSSLGGSDVSMETDSAQNSGGFNDTPDNTKIVLNCEDVDQDFDSDSEDDDGVNPLNFKTDNQVHLGSPAMSADQCETFRTVDYLFLFDPFMKLQGRIGDPPDERMLSSDDYQEMKLINRMLLTNLIIDTEDCTIGSAI